MERALLCVWVRAWEGLVEHLGDTNSGYINITTCSKMIFTVYTTHVYMNVYNINCYKGLKKLFPSMTLESA